MTPPGRPAYIVAPSIISKRPPRRLKIGLSIFLDNGPHSATIQSRPKVEQHFSKLCYPKIACHAPPVWDSSSLTPLGCALLHKTLPKFPIYLFWKLRLTPGSHCYMNMTTGWDNKSPTTAGAKRCSQAGESRILQIMVFSPLSPTTQWRP